MKSRSLSPRIVSLLLEHGADIRVTNILENTPLHLAILNTNNSRIIQMLLEHGADPNARNSFQETPLHGSAYEGKLRITELLLDAGADPRLTDKFGNKPEFYAKKSSIRSILNARERYIASTDNDKHNQE